MNWVYDEAGKVYLSGKNNSGCGVFQDGPENLWYGNVVIDGEILFIGPFNSLEEAQRAAETEYNIIKERSDHENGNSQ